MNSLENHLNCIERNRIYGRNVIETAMNCGLFDDPQALKFFDMMIEHNKLEKIFIDAIRKKNIALTDLLIKKINEIMLNMMEMCNDWVNDAEGYVNEQSYLLVCEHCKLTNKKLNRLNEYVKQLC